MWLPKWLGEAYSKLYEDYGNETFSLAEASKTLDKKDALLRVIISRLHASRHLLILGRGRPRQYRLLHPSYLPLIASGSLNNLNKIKQERYVNLLCGALREASKICNMVSFAVYGSVARGRGKEESDVDVLLIAEDFHDSLGRRVERLLPIEQALREEMDWLAAKGWTTSLSFCPFNPQEVLQNPPILLDLTEEVVILYDKASFLSGVLTSLKERLQRMGAKRIAFSEEEWYWDLKPNFTFGERIEL